MKELEKYPEFAKCPDLLLYPPNREEVLEEWGQSSQVDQQLLDRCDELIKGGITRGAWYWMMRETGSNDGFAAMIALQQGPGLDTDDVFFSGARPLYEQFGSDDEMLGNYIQASKRRGFTPPANSTYYKGLARFQGDPEAYVTRAMGRSYIRKLIEKRGGKISRDMDVTWNEPESDPLAPENCKPLGEDIIQRKARQMARRDPNVLKKDRRELREQIIDRHGPKS